MKQEFENNTQDVQMEQYEAPRIEVIEMEIEGPILQMSDKGNDHNDWYSKHKKRNHETKTLSS